MTFANSLVVSYVLSRAVYDAGETDPKQAIRLRMAPREGAALGATIAYVLTGFAAYSIYEHAAENGGEAADDALGDDGSGPGEARRALPSLVVEIRDLALRATRSDVCDSLHAPRRLSSLWF